MMSSVREKRAAEQKAANKREEVIRLAGKIDKLVEQIEATPVPEQEAEEKKPAKKKAKAKAKAKKAPKKAT
jgi:hypothetical protein